MSWSSGLLPGIRPYAEYLVGYFPSLRITSVYRSPTEQRALWLNRGRNPYPVAFCCPSRSMHTRRRAWDMTGPRDQLELAGRIWESWGGRWGGATDPIHFEV